MNELTRKRILEYVALRRDAPTKDGLPDYHRWVLTSFGPSGDPSGQRTSWMCHRCGNKTEHWREPDKDMRIELGNERFTCGQLRGFVACAAVHES